MPQIDRFTGHDDVPQGVTYWHKLCACQKRRDWHRALTYAQIQAAAKNSCAICDAFDKVIVAVVDGCLPELFRGPRDEAERTRILDELVVRPPSFTTANQESELTISIMDRWVRIGLFRDADEQSKFRVRDIGFPPEPQFGPTTTSERGFERARGWLRQCLEHHDCGTRSLGSGPSRSPKRLLDLRRNQIRLFETDTIGSNFNEPYVCLSHRWGDAQYTRLTSTVNTIQNHFLGILWEDLPKTFQDAVTICRRMCVEYLWIDSLCILQEYDNMPDDEAKKTKADFAQENSYMATIYRNSYFTISADISTSMMSGIFCTRVFESHKIQVIDDNGNPAFFRVRERTSHWTEPTDLETRGWTFQEYVLPARVLGFGPFDITWRCQKAHNCECGHITGASDWRDILGKTTRPASRGVEDVQYWWQWMVRFYSSRKLTNERDKLPALSGVAQLYHEATSDTYLAGLWNAFLHEGLCWFHSKEPQNSPFRIHVGRRRDFRSPSWSWASIDTYDDAVCCFWRSEAMAIDPMLINNAQTRNVCTIYKAECKPKTKDAFGEVELGAFINLGAMLFSATIAKTPEPDMEWNLVKSGKWSVRGLLPWTLRLVEDDREVTICLPDCRLEDDGLKLGDAVYCAPIRETFTIVESQTSCLILKRLKGQEYRRVGFCLLGKRNPRLAQYMLCDRPIMDLTTTDYADSIQDYALQYSQETEVQITIL